MVAALQMAVICYGLQKHYEFWSRSWVATKNIFNFVKSKIGRKEKEAEEKREKPNEIQLKIRKSSLKRLGQIL